MNVGLFVTCLVDLVRPEVGFATVKLLEQGGCHVSIPEAQTCCGQPAFNSGDAATTRPIAEDVIRNFESFDYVVVPSGSCAGMIKTHYPELFANDFQWQRRALDLAEKTYELTTFLTEVLQVKLDTDVSNCTVTYHDSCSGLRELGIKQQPRSLLSMVDGCELTELNEAEVCCGFGGTFCVKYAEVSGRIVDNKIDNVLASRADNLLGGDMGCLMNIAGRLKRQGHSTRVFHIAEFLTGQIAGGGIAETDEAMS